MRAVSTTAIAFAAMAFLAASPAMAQQDPATGARPGNDIGTGQSLPLSNNASNISSGDTHSSIAPRLPSPPVSDQSSPRDFLMAAKSALQANKTGEAQEALERAETRALAGNVLATQVNDPSQQPMVQMITTARQSLAAGDKAGALATIDSALTHN